MIEGPFALAFVTGMVAAVNPCGFAMLPAYLSFFLGIEYRAVTAGGEGVERASVWRAILVSLAVSAGFLTVFVILGAVIRAGGDVVADVTPYVSLLIGVAVVALGIAMLRGYRLPLVTPRLDKGGQTRTASSMYVFGISYAIASLGCTIPTFIATVLGSFTRDGTLSGIVTIAMYGAGMALLLTALTVSLALAEGGLLRSLRRVLPHVDRVAAVLLVLAGLYVLYYGWYEIASDTGSRRVGGDGLVSWAQERVDAVATWLVEQGAWTLLLLFGGVICAGALVAVLLAGRHSDASAGETGRPEVSKS